MDRGIALPFFNLGSGWGGGAGERQAGPPTPGRKLCPLCRRLAGPQGLCGRVRKISAPPGFEPQPSSPFLYRLRHPVKNAKSLYSNSNFLAARRTLQITKVPVAEMIIQIIPITFSYTVCQDSSVGIATTLQVGRSGDRTLVVTILAGPFKTGPWAQPAYCRMSTWPLFQGVKRSERGDDHPLHLATALLPIWVFMACYRVIFTFYLYIH